MLALSTSPPSRPAPRRQNPAAYNMRQLRRAGRLREFISVQLHPVHRCVNIASDSGRVCRPLIVVGDSGRAKLTPQHMAELRAGSRSWDDFIREGVIEYLDVNE